MVQVTLPPTVYKGAHGQCRFEYSSPTQCKLVPRGGGQVLIDGKQHRFTNDITVSNSGLSASTLYRAYLYDNGGTLTVELSTTARARHSDGVEIKTGDSSRTFVGLAFTTEAAQFAGYTSSGLYTRSWFNEPALAFHTSWRTVATSSTSTVEWSAGPTIDVVTFVGEDISLVGGCSGYSTGGDSAAFLIFGRDGTPFSMPEAITEIRTIYWNDLQNSFAFRETIEGRHYYRFFVRTSAHTWQIQGGTNFSMTASRAGS